MIRRPSPSRWLLLALLLSSAPLWTCQSNLGGPGNGNGDGSMVGPCSMTCPNGQTCFDSACIPDVKCQTDDDCQDDSYCYDGQCIPYGLLPRGPDNPACQRVVPAGLLAPQIFCEWAGPDAGDPFPNHMQVLSAPLVVDFNFDNHRSVDNPTIHPSIVINTYDGTDGACGLGPNGDGANYGVIRVLDGRTCKQQYVIATHVNGATTPALGDINGDGRADILAMSASGGLVAFSYDPPKNQFDVLWTSHTKAGAASNPAAGLCEWTGPALADINNDGHPESLIEGAAYDATGALLGSVGALNAVQGVGQFPVVADILKDGVTRLVTPSKMFKWDTATSNWAGDVAFPATLGDSAFVAVADFGTVTGTGSKLDRTKLDGIAEIALVSGGSAWLLSAAGQIVFGPVALPSSKGGGPPTIGDFDGDGRPEFAAAGSNSYTVFDPDCIPGAAATYCPTRSTTGVLWTSQSQDLSSNITGSSLFDFEGDGTAKAVYADECFARIYDGKTGEVLFSQEHSSCTWTEYPTVADVQGNFRSKLIVPSNVNCGIVCPDVDPVFKGLRCQTSSDCPNTIPCDSGYCRCTGDAQCNVSAVGGGFVCRAAPAGLPGTGETCQAEHTVARSGIRVFGDVQDRWVSSRPLWNQHTYSVTNVQDDGTIPATAQTQINWEQKGLNNYRENVQGTLSPQATPDFTAQANGDAVCQTGGVTLTAHVCNRGTAPTGDGLPVTFYENGTVVCTGTTLVAIAPGTCAPASCVWPAGGNGQPHTLTISADDDGKGGHPIYECDPGNDKAMFTFMCVAGQG